MYVFRYELGIESIDAISLVDEVKERKSVAPESESTATVVGEPVVVVAAEKVAA